MYRNKQALISNEGVEVDSESLWIKKGELMILVDDDQYITYPYYINAFYKV